MGSALEFMAAEAIVSAVGSTAWKQMQQRVAELFRRRGMDGDAEDLARFGASPEEHSGAGATQEHWRDRLQEVLVDAPETVAEELKDILDEFMAASGDTVDFRQGTFHGPVTGVQHLHYGPAAAFPDPGTWPAVRTADPIALGVHRTRRFDEESELAPYVGRDADDRLIRLLHRGGLVVVTGGPFSGKSRTAWAAAAAALPPDTRLCAPAPGADLQALPGILRERPGAYVLWLDELEGHLGETGLDTGLLAQLTGLGVPIVATMRDDAYDARRFGGGRASRVLSRAETVELRHAWSGTELGRLAQADDPRLLGALKGRGDRTVPEYLAVGPELWDEWRRARRAGAHPRGHLLVRAAVDAARCGFAGPLPADALERIAQEYGHEVPRSGQESIDEALAWATRPRYGVTGLLVPDTEDETVFAAYGSLVADLPASGEPADIPVTVWFQLLDAAEDKETEAAVVRTADRLLTPRAEAGVADAMVVLGGIAMGKDNAPEAVHWFRKALEAGVDDVKLQQELHAELGELLVATGETEAGLRHLRAAAEQGDAAAAYRVSLALRESADDWLRRAAAAGHPTAMAELGPAADTVEK
ncbi:tetratricopeptide repeat protein [Streptomyces sp. NPDC101151]|uniref:tetratricopeptide repeat protein n=1 Tax=Streptomyces sp. NPDC101151 TaxID=3366115 RepID=UPI0037F63426